ncbi:helix-turn-helix domain-containing protein [Prosthecobacter fluviatilis]|uniref:Helix-turn-helix domain-containing protein n=1 Tax=Prosthecobacter fluviatilis TaxID=445931 RepID=A0ABW0KTP9_9BACT
MSTAKDTNTPAHFLTPADLAARWKITPMTLRRWRKAGKIKASMLGRGVRFALPEVERFEREAQA